MTFGGIKVYHLVFLDFWKSEFKIFKYEKDRRYTARQAWNIFYHSSDDAFIIGKLPTNANIFNYEKIVDDYGFNIKYCDRYLRFPPLK